LERISDFLALERKARLASERSAEARAGLVRRSKKIGWRKGEVHGGGFHAAFFISALGVAGLRFVS
jgi:hypothetical protein